MLYMSNRFLRSNSILALAITPVIASTSVSAQETCSPFTLVSTGEGRSVEYIDIGVEGSSRADKRIGVRDLTAQDGSAVGQARWILTVLEPKGEGSGASYIDWVFSLPDGVLFAKGLKAVTSAPDDTSKQSSDNSDQFAIVGGTGVFAGARGTHTKSLDGLKEIYSIEITCE